MADNAVEFCLDAGTLTQLDCLMRGAATFRPCSEKGVRGPVFRHYLAQILFILTV